MALVLGLLLNWKPAGSGALSAFAREIACRGGAVAWLLPLSAFLSALRLCMMCFLQGKPHLLLQDFAHLLALHSLHVMNIILQSCYDQSLYQQRMSSNLVFQLAWNTRTDGLVA